MINFIKRFIWLINNFRFYLVHQGNEITRLRKRVHYLEMQITRCVKLKKVARKTGV
jgi:hypothetical protein